MNIWLPIASNIIIALIIVIGIFEGRKNGALLQLVKAFCLAGIILAFYFLSPLITHLLLKIPVIAQFTTLTSSFTIALNSVVYLILFLIGYFIISQIIRLFRNMIINSKVKAPFNDKQLIKRQRKAALKSRSKVNKLFGALFGIVTALVFSFIVMMPVKYIPETIVEVKNQIQEQIDELPEEAKNQVNVPSYLIDAQPAFEYTMFGQLDKVTHVYDLINNIGE